MKKNHFKYLICSFLVIYAFGIKAAIPTGYYDAADGKSGAELKTAMHQIVQNFINLDFDGFTATYWGENYFKSSDWHSDGYYWDMYSNIQYATYNSSLLAREHCMPRSWWGTSADYGRANGDLNNLFPSDFTANGRKSNLPLGQTANPNWTNNVTKVGQNSYSTSYTGNVFEPADEYKGDFARTYLYMVTSYEDYNNRWKDEGMSMLNNETYPVFKDWAISLLLDWCRQDPVSQKEINRNDSVFRLQQNRNPFIDIPDLVEYIWGNKKTQTISIENKATQATLITPSVGASINFGNNLFIGNTRTRSIPIKGVLLNSPIIIDFLENTSGFFSTVSEVTTSQANQPEGYFLPIVYSPTSAGANTAKLRISSDDLATPIIVQLQGLAVDRDIIAPVEPTDEMDVILFYTGPWTKASLPSNFTTNAASAPYSDNGDFSFRSNKEYLTIEIDEEPDILQFSIYPRRAWTPTRINHLYVYEGTSSATIGSTPIADFDNSFVVNETYNNTPLIQLSENTRAIKIEYIKDYQNVGINNLIITRKNANSLDELNENKINIFCVNGLLYIENVNIGETVCIYDVLGRLRVKETIVENQTVIPIRDKGIFILKTNSAAYKFVAK